MPEISMTSQEKPTYRQVQSRYETLRQIAFEDLSSVMPNKRGMAILKNTIILDGVTLGCQGKLRKWEKTGLRRVVWGWDKVLKTP